MRANIDVDDLERGIAFYTSVFGLIVTRRLGEGWAELSGGSFVIDLLRKDAGSAPFAGAATKREYARHWTPVHLDFCVDDIGAAVERAKRAGARLTGGIESRAFGKMALLSDPWGHGFCILQLVGAGYDAVPGVVRP